MRGRVFGWAVIAGALAAGTFGLAAAQPSQNEPQQPPAEVAPTTPEPTPVPGAPQPGAAAAPPDESLPESDAAPRPPSVRTPPKAPAPPRRTLYTAAVIQVLDKVTAESLRFEAPVHQLVRYKGLIFLVNTCQGSLGDEPAAAHVQIASQPPTVPGRPPNPAKVVFRGWMYADTPGPHPFEHPVYDAWLIACKTASGGA